ncbi:fatty-acid--CoA ligase [Rhodococcus sp. AD45-ID]|uniref:class I adenylate-forming enzyme family protein n=1 Tax=unclassified Rhodococcus (in: high G+C Gram-positive bacteria) TaxID=192944 RepID=UPI0005D3E195|nr:MULTISPECIES: class I adenylate-forming enzyme family protein [unclassified Rhodococcus (in: high G+C Gram-positive bacteria)]KJF23215.1 2,3-dihydroxybenzoate-AMP ligase [Rhodococcus sp. AD45]PSR41705.1 fatty-acid--CoA ligase [Rhodococcus sp. AD45-ID]RZL21502.1 MAG: fatty-acid--CoA ligase [Rhodococcus sp. (in: high G+C Gram-positive bacteria)]
MQEPTTLDVAIGEFALDPDRFSGVSISEIVRHWSETIPDRTAFITPTSRISWAQYDAAADAIASALELSSEGYGHVAVLLPDTMVFHAALCAAYRTGRVAVGIGSRSGLREISHLIERSDATVLVTTRSLRGVDTTELISQLRQAHPALDVVFADDTGAVSFERAAAVGGVVSLPVPKRVFEASSPTFSTAAVSMLNSTSGTTGLPKLVTQTEDRWVAFSEIGAEAADVGPEEVFLGAVPAPFGFGLWTSHFLPALLGAPNVVMERFDVAVMIDLIEREGVTVLNCVSTQFKMLLRSDAAASANLDTLRVMFTGGEAVPYSEALAFEERTGAAVLQFYGSNETGAVSVTTVDDDSDTRLRTCGHVIDRMQVRVFDDAAKEVVGSMRRGQPAVNGPLMCQGYWGDVDANNELYTEDGWMLLGDIVEIDEDGRVRVVGRKADIIIRGGKNISAVEVEEYVRAHPLVDLVAAVGVDDALFGEKVCAVVVTTDSEALSAAELTEWMREQGITREYIPEYVMTLAELPMAAGGKVAKGAVKELVREKLAEAIC